MSVPEGELLVLLLSNGMSPGEFSEAVGGLLLSVKHVGSQKRRDLLYEAYSKLASKASLLETTPHCLLQYRVAVDTKGANSGDSVEVAELTNRQRGLLARIDFLGHKIKPAEDPNALTKSKAWLLAFCEEEAQIALDDLMSGEPCIYVTSDGVYVATRYKRVRCKALSAMPKTAKDVQEVVVSLEPNKPLQTVAFVGNEPPSVNNYNVFLAGPIDKNLGPTLPPTVGHVSSTSTSQVYDYFLQRRNGYLLGEAGKLISQMLADIGRGAAPLVFAGCTKDASKAYKNSLMKRVFVHESMGKFVRKARSDGQVELWVIQGDVENSDFGRYGKLVFELFYRADLSMY